VRRRPDARRHRPLAACVAGVALITVTALVPVGAAARIPQGKADPAVARAARTNPDAELRLIVRETVPSSVDAERLVTALGGDVGRRLAIVGGFAARLPGSRLADLVASNAVARVWGDGRITVNAIDMGQFDTWPANTIWQKTIRLPLAASLGGTTYDGNGVTVAVLDTGVSPVADLGDRVLARVDFTPDRDGYDRYGHGTHMAGIIAGDGAASGGAWAGVAPAANLVSVKVAGADGSTDVSVVLAGLEWIVSHREEFGIRILNLSFGTDSTQPYSVDPLNYAVERVWFSGIFVVVSAGNRGPGPWTLNKPGDDPFVLTVGAADLKGTIPVFDDTIAPFSSRGSTWCRGPAKPEISAPGVTIVSNRLVGGTIDTFHPLARVGDAYFKGSGTSQAAAVVSGVAALMYQANPTLTPDIAKAILVRTANRSYRLGSSPLVDAAGAVFATLAHTYDRFPANRGLVPSTGLGSLELSRGTHHVYADLDGDGVMEPVVGEVDVLGALWDARSWSARSWSADTWDSSVWSTYTEETAGWNGPSWSARSWSGTAWDARSWSGQNWTSSMWSGGAWS
jgi:serine protease AprX